MKPDIPEVNSRVKTWQPSPLIDHGNPHKLGDVLDICDQLDP